jgi:DNA-binding response OmpR family regulator
MLTNQQIVQSALHAPEKISILLVSPHADDQAALRRILHHDSWSISRCADASEALPQLCSTLPAVVVCERDLPDGSWKTILAACEALANAPLLLVTSRYADESLWAEVLNLGGYDVLLKPFDRAEVTRVIGMAWRKWYSHSIKQPVASATGLRTASASASR